MVSFKFAALSGARQCRVGARTDTSRCLDGIACALGRICVVTGANNEIAEFMHATALRGEITPYIYAVLNCSCGYTFM